MTNYSNVHELVSDLVACALIEGARPTSFSASIETKRVKQLLLNEIEDRSRELRKLKAHGNEPNRGSQGAGETMPVAKPVRRPASLTHEPFEHRCEDRIMLNDVVWRCTKPENHRDHERQPEGSSRDASSGVSPTPTMQARFCDYKGPLVERDGKMVCPECGNS